MPPDLMTAEEAGRLLEDVPEWAAMDEAGEATRIAGDLTHDGWHEAVAAALSAGPRALRTVVALHAEVARLTAEVEDRRERDADLNPRMAAVDAVLDLHVRALLDRKLGREDYPLTIIEDGDDAWAFWVHEDDATSYVHSDGKIEWYGTGWPDNDDADEVPHV